MKPRTMRLVIATIAVLVLPTLEAQSRKRSLTGTWNFTIESDSGIGTPTVTLSQQGKTLTGHYSGTLFGEAELKGTVRDTAIAFTVFARWQGEPRDLLFTGEYDGSGTIKGTYSNDFGDGKFTAMRNSVVDLGRERRR